MAIATVDVNFPVGTNIDLFDVGLLSFGVVVGQAPTSYSVALGDEAVTFTGTGFTYTAGQPDGGTITGIQDSYFGAPVFAIQGLSIPVATFNAWVLAQDNLAAQTTIFAGDDAVPVTAQRYHRRPSVHVHANALEPPRRRAVQQSGTISPRRPHPAIE